MKPKITIVCFLLFTSISFSQNLQVFESFEEFQTAVTNNCSTSDLTFESFDNIVFSLCNVPVLPDPNQECISPDELADGFTIQGLNQTNMVANAIGQFGDNPINIVGPNNTQDTTLINFVPSVNAVSFSTWQFVNNPSSFSIEVYGENDQLLGSFVRDSSIKALYSFFAISDEPIARIESKANVEVGISSAGVLVGALYFGASDCTTFIDPTLSPDYDALVAFYNSTNGNDWTNNDNWLNTTVSLSEWFGLTIENGRVVDLLLNENNLQGTIPPEIQGLSNLKRAILGKNFLNGSIPSEIGNILSLEFLNVNTNNLEGEIPSTFNDLANLKRLYVYDNNMTGQIPNGLATLTNLEQLLLTDNNFVGSIPDFSQNTFLDLLWIDNNYFDFSDIEPLAQAIDISDFRYSPQRTQDVAESITTGVGESLTLNVNDTNIGRDRNTTAMTNQYQWYKDNSAISGANGADYTITNAQVIDSGDYFCEITNSILPDLVIVRAPISVLIDPNLSIIDLETDGFELFPNPSKDWLSVKIKSGTEAVAQVFDITGKLILTKELSSEITAIALDNLLSGMYLIKVSNDTMQSTKRFIKK